MELPIGLRSILQVGHCPGDSDFTSGCIGQVYIPLDLAISAHPPIKRTTPIRSSAVAITCLLFIPSNMVQSLDSFSIQLHHPCLREILTNRQSVLDDDLVATSLSFNRRRMNELRDGISDY
jgi:hypothetical protein